MLSRSVVRNQRVLAAGLGGITGSILDIAVLVACVESGMAVAPAAFLGASAGAGACFLANKYWAFRDRRPLSLRQAGTFGLVAVGTALLMALAMSIVAVKLGVPYLKAKAICAATVFLIWSYPAQRRFVFRHIVSAPIPVPVPVPDADLDAELDAEPLRLAA